MTPEQLQFLAAIRAQPADDLPRLVYADFLEETGDEARAHFIRVGCEWHRSRCLMKPDRFPDHWPAATGWTTCSSPTCLSCPFGHAVAKFLRERETEFLPPRFSKWFIRPGRPRGAIRSDRWFTMGHEPGVVFWSRGFPSHVQLAPEAWLEYGEELVSESAITSGVILNRHAVTLVARVRERFPSIEFAP